jgi:hypothetical protein
MTTDIVALLRNEPDIPTVVEGMIAFGESVESHPAGDGVTHLYNPEGQLLVSIEAPTLVQVPGEAERLLGPEMRDQVRPPTWWVEVRAAAGIPDAPRVARKFADDIVHWQGGVVWDGPPPPTDLSPSSPMDGIIGGDGTLQSGPEKI